MAAGPTAQTYVAEESAEDGLPIVRLDDPTRHIRVSIALSLGNTAYEFSIKGRNALYFPFHSVTDWAAHPRQVGIPLLAPWANRLSADSFYANGKKYLLNPNVLPIGRDTVGQPIHGLLLFAHNWEIARIHADQDGAEVTSILEFWKNPGWMAQFPFAHRIEMTHRLASGVLEVRLAVCNLCSQPMPLVVGFHPWYQITDTPRDKWRVHLPVRARYRLSSKTIPTGDIEPVRAEPELKLAGRALDDLYGEIDHDDAFLVCGASQNISVRFGPKYTAAIAYSPLGSDFICFEPMSGITDGFNLAHAGRYSGLQKVLPGQMWIESFWITPTGYQ